MKIKPLLVHRAKLSDAAGGSPVYGRIPVAELIQFNNDNTARKVWVQLTPNVISELRAVLGAAVSTYEEAAAFARKSLGD